ncbi:RHS repeat domain-containing protein [Methanobrevibacter sp.]|uniref:RHS repeat domain-containing protein n=1 Tax=Methanobrevibacter sp. TaxID=66852 RepID=UPI00386C985F
MALDYFGARYLDPILGMWISVDPKRQFSSPYLYAGNGYNPVNVVDPDGNAAYINKIGNNIIATVPVTFWGPAATAENIANVKAMVQKHFSGKFGSRNVTIRVVEYDKNKHGELNNYVWLEENIYSYVDASSLPKNAYININSKRNTLHEFAHLLGLGDRYHHKQDDPQWGVPYKGYKHNLMGGEAGELNLDPSQIEEMWSPDYNYTEDNVNSQNLYEYNVIFEE